MTTATSTPAPVRLGLRANLPQFILLVAVNALVGGMIGQERTVLPLLADKVFAIGAFTASLTFIVAFGVTKAFTNLAAGVVSDRYGRKPVLVAGWLIGLPVPLLLIWAPSWWWIIAANVLLGINQGLTWSTTIVMKIDLVGPARRGLAMGFNEAAGYLALSATSTATGWLAAAYGLRPAPFLLGLAFAALGLGLSAVLVRDTHRHARHEATTHVPIIADHHDGLTGRQIFTLTSFREKALSAASQAGLVNNLNDALAWGLFPILFAASGLGVARIGVLVAMYPLAWSIGQMVTGGLSDRWGRKWLIAAGMLLQAAGIAMVAATTGFAMWTVAAVLMGAGTAMVYPVLLAVIGDVAHPTWRARAVGAYRLWRDLGYAAGALIAGVSADLLGLRAAIWIVAAITAASGIVVAVRMYETHPPPTRPTPFPDGGRTRMNTNPALDGQPIYLDYNATTPVDPAVLEAMRPWETQFGNPASGHHYATAPAQALSTARAQVAALIGADPAGIVFTGSGSEADNLAIRGTILASPERRRHVIIQATEHPAVLATCHALQRLHDIDVTVLPVDRHGRVDPDDLRAAIGPHTALVSIMLANNETGTLQPIPELAAIAHAYGALLHTDAAQAVGKIGVDVAALDADLLTVVGHKMYAPKGIAALYMRSGLRLEPATYGGGQEQGLRSGTENVTYAAGLGAAADLARAGLDSEHHRLAGLRDRLHQALDAALPGRVHLNGHPDQRLPNTLNISIAGVIGNDLLAAAPQLAASTGSACHTRIPEPSPVLAAMGLDHDRALGAVRLSLGRWTTTADIDRAAQLLTTAAQQLRPTAEHTPITA
jgi:cysteine sulfinate desulfinase/cysteine desulfurase-like protein/MFS family permease